MNGIQLTTWQALKAGISSTTKAMVAWMATNPIGWFTLLAGATVGTALVLKQFNTTLDEAGKTLSEQNEKFKSLSDEVTTLDDELKTTEDRIKELEGLPSLTIVEDEELQKLKDTTAELEYQLAIKKEEQRLEAEKTAKAANDAYNASYQRMYDGNGELITSPTNENWNPVQELKNTMKAYEVYKKSYDELQAKITQDSEAGENTSKDQKRLSNIKKQMTSIEEHAKEMADVVNDQKEAYEGLYAAGFDVQGNDLAIYEEVRDGTEAYREFCNTLNDTTKAYNELPNEEKRQSILSKAVLGGKTKEEAQKIVDSISDEDLEFVAQIHFNRDSTIQSVHDEIDAIKSEANSYGNGNETDILSFSDAWNSKDFEDARKELLSLAEAGQLTPETLESTEEYKTLLEQTGLSAEEAAKKINSMTDASTQLNALSGQISKMSDMLADKKNGTVASASDLAGFDATVKGLESWDEFERVMGSSKSSMEECQAAANALATEWVNNGNFLANLTKENKDYYIYQLKSMGVENAAIVVTEALSGKKEALRLKYLALNAVLTDFEGKTNGACARLLEEEGATDQTRQALADLVSQEILFNNSSLDVSGKISALNQLALAAYGVSDALNGGMGLDSKYYNGKTAEERVAEKWKILSSAYNTQKVTPSKISINPNGSSDYKNKGSKDNKQTIDWISRLLDVIQKKIDQTKSKFENLFTVKSKDNNLAKQIEQTRTLLDANSKAAEKYKKKADNVKLSDSIKKKVQNGSYSITDYDSKTANKITKYQEYLDKYSEITQKSEELTTTLHQLQEQQYQLYVDQADAMKSALEAKKDNAFTSTEKNNIISQEVAWLEQSYKYQMDIAMLNKDNIKYAELEAKLEKEKRDLFIEQYQNIQDEADAYVSLLEAQVENANTAESKNILLEQENGFLATSYDYQIAIAEINGELVKATELRAKKQKELLDLSVKQLENIQEELEANYNLYQQYEQNAVGAKAKNIYERQSREYLKAQYKDMIEIANVKGDIVESTRLQLELESKISESHLKEFQNISSQYDFVRGIIDSEISHIDSLLSQAEKRGKKNTTEYYELERAMIEKQRQETLDSISELESKMSEMMDSGEVAYGSDQWQEMDKAIRDAKSSLDGFQEKLLDIAISMRKIEWDYFDEKQSAIDSYTETLEHYKSLISDEGLFNEDGSSTKYGDAYMKLNIAEYKARQEELKNARNEYQRLISQEDMTDKNVYDRAQELQKTIWEKETNLKSIIDDLADKLKESFQKIKETLSDTISDFTNALDSASSIRDYQRDITDKSRNVQNLEAQMMAYSGDTSEEGKAAMQRLQKEYADAQADLSDTEYKRWLSDQKDLLANLEENFEDFINEYDYKSAIQRMIVDDAIKGQDGIITTLSGKLSEVTGNIITTVDNSITNTFGENGSVNKAIKSVQSGIDLIYEQGFGQDGIKQRISYIETAISDFKAGVTDNANSIKTDMNANTSSINNYLSSIESILNAINTGIASIPTTTSTPTESYTLSTPSESASSSSSGTSVDFYKESTKNRLNDQYRSLINGWKTEDNGNYTTYGPENIPGNKLQTIKQILATLGYNRRMDLDVDTWGSGTIASIKAFKNANGLGGGGKKIGAAFLRKLKENIDSYATGGKDITDDFVFTNENGLGELIRTKDGAILTPLGNGAGKGMVFNNEQSKALWNLSKSLVSPSILPLPNLNTGMQSYQNGNTFGDVNFEITMQDVNSPEELAKKFKAAFNNNTGNVRDTILTGVDSALSGGNSSSSRRYR